ncbi:hypothetical protein ENSA5_10910 [Enhygromyxa salina]|uniref:Uncharacterized protein n=1 Tax=Enhygromyxa salina TaxID=215803 RepID=A0A2S9YG69_9BACT|nr:hypothetical protein ENSA5_10910 [Enhygromyxa salina]
MDGVFEALALVLDQVIEAHERVDLGLGQRSPPGPAHELVDDLAQAHVLAVGEGVAGDDHVAQGVGDRIGRALDLEVVDQEVAVLHEVHVVVVVGEPDRDLVDAGVELDLDLVDLGELGDDRGDVGLVDEHVVDGHDQVGEIGAGLLTVGAGREQVGARAAGLEGRVDLAVRPQVPKPSAGSAGAGGDLHALGFPVVELGVGGHAQGVGDHGLGRARVELELQRGQALDVRDVVEAVAVDVRGELGGRRPVDHREEQVLDGVVVLGVVEAVDGHAPGILGELVTVAVARVTVPVTAVRACRVGASALGLGIVALAAAEAEAEPEAKKREQRPVCKVSTAHHL